MAIRFDCNLMSTACSLSNISKETFSSQWQCDIVHNVDKPYDESLSSRFDSLFFGNMFRQIRCISSTFFEKFLA